MSAGAIGIGILILMRAQAKSGPARELVPSWAELAGLLIELAKLRLHNRLAKARLRRMG